MANEYLIDIHSHITEKIKSAEGLKAEAIKKKDRNLQRFYEGQLAEWRCFRAYLAEKVDLKTQKYY